MNSQSERYPDKNRNGPNRLAKTKSMSRVVMVTYTIFATRS
jgi:hypothetical protein